MFGLHREATLTCESIALRPVPNWSETGAWGGFLPFGVDPGPATSTTWTAYLDSSVMKSEIVYSAGSTTAAKHNVGKGRQENISGKPSNIGPECSAYGGRDTRWRG